MAGFASNLSLIGLFCHLNLTWGKKDQIIILDSSFATVRLKIINLWTSSSIKITILHCRVNFLAFPDVSHLSVSIPDPLIELLALEDEEVVSRLVDAALHGYWASGVHVVASHHADCDASLLAFPDGFGYLWEYLWLIIIFMYLLTGEIWAYYWPHIWITLRVLQAWCILCIHVYIRIYL